VDDGHPVTCAFNLDLESRPALNLEDFTSHRRSTRSQHLAVTRFGSVALRNAATTYSNMWRTAWRAAGVGRVAPSLFFSEYLTAMRTTILPGGATLSNFLTDAGAKLITGVIEELGTERDSSVETLPELVEATVWNQAGFSTRPLAVAPWLLGGARRSVSILGKRIPGP